MKVIGENFTEKFAEEANLRLNHGLERNFQAKRTVAG
jgi:hypothetical protein